MRKLTTMFDFFFIRKNINNSRPNYNMLLTPQLKNLQASCIWDGVNSVIRLLATTKIQCKDILSLHIGI